MTTTDGLSSALLRRTFSGFPSGVTAVCAVVDDTVRGLVASSFTSVSLAPALASICVSEGSDTWPLLRKARRFGINVLAAGQEQLCRQMAAKDVDRFAEVDFEVGTDDAVILADSALWLVGSLHTVVPAGDHSIVIFEIHEVCPEPHKQPLVFHESRFKQLAQTG